MILPAQAIRKARPIAGMVERYRIWGMTYGLGPAGYDVRIAQDVTLWPGKCRLASTLERFLMPDDLIGVVHDKSSWARRGVAVQNTVIEPGWEGYLTLELTLHRWRPLRVRAGMPIAQIIFHRLEEPTELPYSGKYQFQGPGPVPALFE